MKEQEIKTGVLPDRIRRGEFPKDPEERFRVLLRTFNGTPKILTLMLIPTMGDIKAGDLERKFLRISSRVIRHIDRANVRSNVDANLLPAGFVIEKTSRDEHGNIFGEMSYSRTEVGQEYGIPAAALALYFETQTGISLRESLGPSGGNSDRERAPTIRANVLMQLAQYQGTSLRKQDLANLLSPSCNITSLGNALRSLADNQLIEYSSISRRDKSFVVFEIPPDANPPAIRVKSFKDTIVETCQTLSSEGIPITADAVRARLTTEDKSKWESKNDFDKYLWNTLAMLAKAGFLKRASFVGRQKQSDAKITEKGMLVVNEFLVPLADLANDAPNAAHLRDDIVPEVISHFSDYARQSLKLYAPYAIGNEKKQALARAQVISTIQQAQGGISAGEISLLLENMPLGSIRRYIKTIQKIYPLKVVQKGVVKYYSIDTLQSRFEGKQFSSSIERFMEAMNLEPNISIEDKMSLFAYYVFTKKGIRDTASLLGVSEQQVNSFLENVFASEPLTRAYDRLNN